MRAPDSDERGPWGVYADWLQGRGDPRGERITALLANRREGLDAIVGARPAWAHLCRWMVQPGPVDPLLAMGEVCAVAYPLFAIYARPARLDFCTFCHSPEDIAHYQQTPLREIVGEAARTLVWESRDHWPSPATFKHFLPCMLDALAPPDSCGVLTEEGFVQTLLTMRFAEWPDAERLLLWRYLDLLPETLSFYEAKTWPPALALLDRASPRS